MLRFTLFLTGLAALILVALTVGATAGWFVQPSYSRAILLFLWMTHLIMYGMVVRQLSMRPTDFVKVYLGLTVLRILFFGGFIFLIFRMDRAGAYQNAVFFLLGYFLFTAAEVFALYRVVSRQKPLQKGQKEG